MEELSYNSSEGKRQLTFLLSHSLEQEAGDGLDKWISPIHRKLAAIAERPEYAQLAALEARKGEAETTVASLTERIEAIRTQCSVNVLDAAAMQTASAEIEECERGIKAATLTLESLEPALAAALQARAEVTTRAVKAILDPISRKLAEEGTATEQGIRDAVASGYRALKRIESQARMLRDAGRAEPDAVLALAESYPSGKSKRR